MFKRATTAIISVLVASSLAVGGTRTATAASKLLDPATAGFAEKLYRLDCGHSLANDESVWTPGENVGRNIEFSSTCWLIKRGSQWVLWDTGVPQTTLNDPKGWSTLPKLIVYHLDKSITGQLADIGLKPSDITYVAISHTHGDHIGNVVLFPNSTVLMQRVEYTWISSDRTTTSIN
jgi:N-acyl homoserine lactone hydrolase